MKVDEVLERAVFDGPISLRRESVADAQRWVWRAHNYINRKAPHLARLLIVRRGSTITVMWPERETV